MVEIKELKDSAENTVKELVSRGNKEITVDVGDMPDSAIWAEFVSACYIAGIRVSLFVCSRRLSAKSKDDMALRNTLSDNCVKCSWPKI